MDRLRLLAHLSFFSVLLGCFYIGGVFINYSSENSIITLLKTSPIAFIFVFGLPIVVTALTAVGAFFLLFRESEKKLYIRLGLLGITVVEAFALLILIAWLLTSVGLSFFIYLALVATLVITFVRVFKTFSPKYVFLLQFLVVGLFLSSWYSSMVATYCGQTATETQTAEFEKCNNSAPMASVIGSEVKRIFNR